jgi:hypothetical protein
MPVKLIPSVQGKSKIKGKLTLKKKLTTKRKQNDFSVA